MKSVQNFRELNLTVVYTQVPICTEECVLMLELNKILPVIFSNTYFVSDTWIFLFPSWQSWSLGDIIPILWKFWLRGFDLLTAPQLNKWQHWGCDLAVSGSTLFKCTTVPFEDVAGTLSQGLLTKFVASVTFRFGDEWGYGRLPVLPGKHLPVTLGLEAVCLGTECRTHNLRIDRVQSLTGFFYSNALTSGFL